MHVHLSVTCGGLTPDGEQWKSIYFVKAQVMPMWRHAIVDLLRQSYDCADSAAGAENAVPDKSGVEAAGWMVTTASHGSSILRHRRTAISAT
ncbi:transposase [Paraburkholderia sp. EG287A]|uniref:transposase n=1 Tax=unclassified Paraburkholderia TaxID=2615204 RepID=UPI0034D26617